MMKVIKSYWGHISMLMAHIMFGMNSPIAKQALNDPQISPFSLSAFRMLGATFLFWAVSLFMPKENVVPKDMLRLFFASIFGVLYNQLAYIYGLSMTTPIDASIICTSTPIITMVIAALYLKEPITGKKAGGIFIGATGALLLILCSQQGTAFESGSLVGNVIILSSSFSYAVYLVVFKDLSTKYSSFTMLKWMFLYASVCYIPFSYHDIMLIDFHSLPTNTILSVTYVVFCATFLAYIGIPIGQRLLRPTVVSMYGYVQPIMATTVAIILGLDRFGWVNAVSIALIFTGVYLVTKSKSKAQLDAELKSSSEN